MKYLLLLLVIISFNSFAEVTLAEFMEVAKRTNSVYSGSMDIDPNNPGLVTFETLINDQLTYLSISTTHLNSSIFTVINSQNQTKNKELPTPPEVNINDLDITFTGTQSSTCDGSGVSGGDTSCTSEKNCTISQRIISSCNENDCWSTSPATDRDLTTDLSENFSMTAKIDITDCILSNTQGQKQQLDFTVASGLHGGTINYAVILQNDVVSSKKNRR